MKCASLICAALIAIVALGADEASGQAEVDALGAQRIALAHVRSALKSGNREAAMASMERAVDAGFYNLGSLIEAPEFTELRVAPGMTALLKRSDAQRPKPVIARAQGKADLALTSDGLIWNTATGRFDVTADLSGAAHLPVLATPGEGDTLPSELVHLQKLHDAGAACGLAGILYDNRDRGHSRFDHSPFPQLTRTTYDNALRARSLDYGLGNRVQFSVPTFGNSSTMYKGLTGRALPRRAMTYDGQAEQAFLNYTTNHIYVFPGGVDAFPANWPYSFASGGHSGSDRWILRAVALILAALPCETRAFAEQEGLIASIVQMVFRRAQTGVTTRDTYMSGAAHPAIFNKAAANLIGMMNLATQLKPENLPPMVRLAVEDESFAKQAGLSARSERLFDTPSAIARVWRGFEGRHRLVVNTTATQDPNGRALKASFVLLRGDPDRVRIVPQGDDKAEIIVDWHDEIPLHPERAKRVDIGVFVNNGAHDSAPAFISVLFPEHQNRRHTRGLGGVPRLVSINYDTGRRFDPILFWRGAWEDIFGYDDQGKLAGWIRKRGETRTHYLASGQRADGRSVAYKMRQSGKDLPILDVMEKP